MALIQINNKQWSVNTPYGIFCIMEDDNHTKQMLTDFKTDINKLNTFEDMIKNHGAPYAYYLYNNLEMPIVLIEEE